MADRDSEQQKRDQAAALERLAGGPSPKPQEKKSPSQRPTSPSRPAVPRLSTDRPASPGRSSGGATPRPPVTPPPQLQRRPIVPTTRTDPDDTPTPVFDDDDAVIMPAPNPDVFLPRHHAPLPPRAHLLASMRLRRTLIPILLTSGVMLPALGGMWFMTDEDSPFRKSGLGAPITLIIIGVVLLLLGLLNAFYVKHQLEHPQQTGPV